jgi:serine/threonine protein kinase
MGETPAVPHSLSEEGHQFLQLCLQHDPRQRATASELLHHTFVKVSPFTQEFAPFDLNFDLQSHF